MKKTQPKILLLGAGLLLILAGLTACNSSNPPTVNPSALTGTLPTFSPTPCSGVFGHKTVCSTIDTSYPNYLFLYPGVIYANKVFAGLSLYCASSIPVTYALGLYAANAGGTAPTTLLGQTGMRVSAPVTGWIPNYFNSPVSLSSGVTYWMGCNTSNIAYQTAAASIYAIQSPVTLGQLPPSCVPTPATSFILSLYAITCP